MNDFGYFWVCKWSKQDYLGNTPAAWLKALLTRRTNTKLGRLCRHYQTITHWRTTQPKLAWMTLDILTILAISNDCERAFGEASDLLEPRLSKLRPNIIAALQSQLFKNGL